QLLRQGSNSTNSDSVQATSIAGRAANYIAAPPPYLRTTATYVGIATVVQAIAASASKADKPLPAPNDHNQR
ncbi:hypothetical protein AB4084_14990, partial [Lysobacter sp. 2RAB21]